MNTADSTTVKKPSWRSRLFSAVTACLAHPWIIPGAALLGMLFYLPALWSSFLADDYIHRMIMLDLSPHPLTTLKIFSAYDFTGANPEAIRISMESGLLPWWTAPDFRISFLRYLGSASIWLDYRLWPDSPLLMHLHGIALYGAIVAAAAWFYRRILGAAWIAGLAALMFAFDFRHVGVVSWLANRHGLVALLFGILCLIAHDAWRTSGKKIPAVAAPLFLGLGLFSGEIALATCGFLLSYGLFLDTGPLKRRLAVLVPYGAVFCFWAVVYKVLGHGVHGSGMYIDPTRYPIVFMKGLFRSIPLFLMGQWTLLPAESELFLFTKETTMVIALLVTAFLALILIPFLRHDRNARFFALGMLLALIPIAGLSPENRNLSFVGFAAMPLVALFLGGCVNALDYLPRMRAWRILAAFTGILLAATHLVASPYMIRGGIEANKAILSTYAGHIRSIPDDPELATQTLVLVNPCDYLMSVMESYFVRRVDGRPNPEKYRALAPCSGPIEIHRIDGRTLRVKTPEGLFRGYVRNVYRPNDEPVKEGDEFRLPDVAIHINDADDENGPTDVTYRFAKPLEDPSLRWLKLENDRYVPFTLPAAGKPVMLRGRGFEDVVKETFNNK